MASSASGQDDPNRALKAKFVRSRWLGIGLALFLQKKEVGQNPAISTSHLVNNPYIADNRYCEIYNSGLVFIRNTISCDISRLEVVKIVGRRMSVKILRQRDWFGYQGY